ncbi:MAG: radical SAM/SPASM domain-containing protein [Candidatus Polarisedimenticolia bacterium]
MSRLKIRRYYMDRPEDGAARRLGNRLTRRPIPEFPRTLQIQTVTGCNADCVFCFYGPTAATQPKGRMTDDLFLRILEEASAHPVRRISPYLMNEPLLDRAIADRIRTIHRVVPDAKVVLTTNGHYLTPDLSETFLDLGGRLHEICVSVQGTDAPAYARAMRGNMSLERTLANIDAFEAARRRRRATRPRLRVTMVDTTLIDARAALVFWRRRGIEATATVLDNQGGQIEGGDALSRPPMRPFTDCQRLFKQAYILWNGDVVLCCVDYARRQVLGNVACERLVDVWNGPIASAIRRRYIDGAFDRLPLCGSCRVGELRRVVLTTGGGVAVRGAPG